MTTLKLTWVNITSIPKQQPWVEITESIIELHTKDIIYSRKTNIPLPAYQKKPEHCNGFVTEIHLSTGKTIYVADAKEYISN